MEKKEKGKEKATFDDWMVRIAFAEAGEPDMGFEVTGSQIERKTKLALDKIMVIRSERMSAEAEGEAEKAMVPTEGEGPKEPRGERLRVMVLDDEPIVGQRLHQALSKQGIEVEVFENPASAISRLGEAHFDVVVTDLRMEEINGIQVLEYVTSHCKDTRVILITGYATVEVAREALVKGAFDFIAKPFKPRDLRATINKAALSLGFTAIE
jgi:CheY-like chemotaxis protein